MKNASLVVVGSGIKFLSHLTTEAKTYISQSEKVLYLVNEPAMKEWIQAANSNSEALDGIYKAFSLRLHAYRAITQYILNELRNNQHVCVVIYGHPTVLAQPALNAVIQAKQEGYDARILPAVSAEDCLFADLLIDPGSSGCQSFEATDFLIRRRQFDTRCHLILWQVGIIGAINHPESHNNSKGIKMLFNYLKEHYSLNNEVILYEAAQYPGFSPKIERFELHKLPEVSISRISLLYIPPISKCDLDMQALIELGINLKDLK